MQQKILEFRVEDQHIRAPHYRVVGDSRNYLVARFSFGEAWRGLTKTAVFQGADGKAYHVFIENDRCVVPAEVLQPTQFLLSVFGGDRLTTDRAAVTVEASGMVPGVSPPTPTPDIYDQLLSAVETERQLAQAAAVTAGEKAEEAVTASMAAETAMEAAGDAAAKASAAADRSEADARRAVLSADAAENSADAAEAAAKAIISKVSAAEQAAASAENSANAAAASSDSARESADTASAVTETAMQAYAGLADAVSIAIETANTAADAAVVAAGAAQEAAGAANSAAEQAGNVNMTAEQTVTGADITVTDRNGVDTTVHIDTLFAVNSWEDVRNAVRLGLGAKLFPVGYEFTMTDKDTGNPLVFVVCDHDHHTPANDKLSHSMTLRLKNVYSRANGAFQGIIFDAPEALYYCSEALPAGTYNFVLDYAISGIASGTFQFTLTQEVPAGGQIVFIGNSTIALTDQTIATYASVGAAEAIESGVAITEGSDGSNLGTTNQTTSTNANLNCGPRNFFGSNNYAQSAVRQWMNSGNEAGLVWSPTNKFDRAPSWATTVRGFMHGLPGEFLAAVQPAIIPCCTNSVFEVASLDGTEFELSQVYSVEDKFFLLSRPEIYGTWDSETCKDGEQLELFDGLTDTERIERDLAGTARGCWLRSIRPNTSFNPRFVNDGGSISSNYAITSYGITPACIIA